MSDLRERIGPSRQPDAFFSWAEHRAIEDMTITFDMACARREERMLRELDGLRSDNAALAERNDDLSAALAAMTSRSLHDRERRIVAEQGQTLWLGGLALVTLAVVVWAVTVWR